MVSTIGNMIHLNQNSPAVASKYANYVGRASFSDVLNSDMFEENSKRLKETRETEESAEIDQNMHDSEVYSLFRKGRRRESHEEESREGESRKRGDTQIIDDEHHKIDVKV